MEHNASPLFWSCAPKRAHTFVVSSPRPPLLKDPKIFMSCSRFCDKAIIGMLFTTFGGPLRPRQAGRTARDLGPGKEDPFSAGRGCPTGGPALPPESRR